MNQKEYKELRCRDSGYDCDFLVRAGSEEEVISVVSEHACRAHKVCEITPETRDSMRSKARSVLGGGDWANIREEEWRVPHWEWMEN
jgi:predicted small metal-binding protein